MIRAVRYLHYHACFAYLRPNRSYMTYVRKPYISSRGTTEGEAKILVPHAEYCANHIRWNSFGGVHVYRVSFIQRVMTLKRLGMIGPQLHRLKLVYKSSSLTTTILRYSNSLGISDDKLSTLPPGLQKLVRQCLRSILPFCNMRRMITVIVNENVVLTKDLIYYLYNFILCGYLFYLLVNVVHC
uniref:Myosin motor domain-containing protein n=1 Tax=Elaeophora elaphi TaxID=1147741 RepID=A0A0R3RGP4_9BILA